MATHYDVNSQLNEVIMGIKHNLSDLFPDSVHRFPDSVHRASKRVRNHVRHSDVLTRSNAEVLLVACLAVGAGILAQQLFGDRIKSAANRMRHIAPEKPEDEWKEALVWSVGSGVVVGVSKLLLTRALASKQVRKILHTR